LSRVSIGIPVFNGAKLLEETLENLEQQSFRDFNVYISDNCSTDATPDICQKFVKRDTRFHHIRQSENIGALPNFLAARNLARSPLFMWRAFDDLSADNYIEKLVDVHERDRTTLLATCDILREASPGTKSRFYPYTEKTTGPRLPRFYRQVLRNSASWYYGLWRYDALVEITDRVRQGFPDEWAFDQLTLFGCALRDGIRGTKETSFRQRKIIETRDYIPRIRPTYEEMTARNSRFSAVCYDLIAESDLTSGQKAIVRKFVPYYTLKRCDSASRIIRARLKMW